MAPIFAIAWLLLLYLAWQSRNRFLLIFVSCQFVFVGLGLIVFQYLGAPFLSRAFSSFSWDWISDAHFSRASLLVLSGTAITTLFAALFRFYSVERVPGRGLNSVGRVDDGPFLVLFTIAIAIGVLFIARNLAAILMLLSADSVAELAVANELRRSAVSQYGVTLVVYNLLPAVAVVSLLRYLESPGALRMTLFLGASCLAAFCLVLTFQKRPLIIFLGCVFLAWKVYGFSHKNNIEGFSLVRVGVSNWQFSLAAVAILLMFYYLYTGYRFEMGFLESMGAIAEAAGTRVIGRLAISAPMYVDYFPEFHQHYGLGNIALAAKLIGLDVFADSKALFDHYSLDALDGNVAASVFVDAYGQAGFLGVVFYGVVISGIVFLLDVLFARSALGVSRSFIYVFGFVFVYYLSQASLFRALLGYGGIIFAIVWVLCMRKRVNALAS